MSERSFVESDPFLTLSFSKPTNFLKLFKRTVS